jgi:uncharacterized protein
MRLHRAFRHVMSDVTGRSQKTLVAALAAQVRVARDALLVARSAAARTLSTEEARTIIGSLETDGDRHRASLVLALSQTLVTPIDREDLFRLSRSIDDILDDLRDFARELDLFVEEARSDLLLPPLDAIDKALGELEIAVRQLARDPAAAMAGSLRAKKRGNEIRARYQVALAELYRQPMTQLTLMRRDLLRRLDLVGLRIGEAANALADGGLKRGT